MVFDHPRPPSPALTKCYIDPQLASKAQAHAKKNAKKNAKKAAKKAELRKRREESNDIGDLDGAGALNTCT